MASGDRPALPTGTGADIPPTSGIKLTFALLPLLTPQPPEVPGEGSIFSAGTAPSPSQGAAFGKDDMYDVEIDCCKNTEVQ